MTEKWLSYLNVPQFNRSRTGLIRYPYVYFFPSFNTAFKNNVKKINYITVKKDEGIEGRFSDYEVVELIFSDFLIALIFLLCIKTKHKEKIFLSSSMNYGKSIKYECFIIYAFGIRINLALSI
ncbi:MAG: hypothetical protein IID03_02335 [Candidatus Dadabacteria bacterium]|nr:hypothetical protein [Candidatus Dadabacteria bacterium]